MRLVCQVLKLASSAMTSLAPMILPRGIGDHSLLCRGASQAMLRVAQESSRAARAIRDSGGVFLRDAEASRAPSMSADGGEAIGFYASYLIVTSFFPPTPSSLSSPVHVPACCTRPPCWSNSSSRTSGRTCCNSAILYSAAGSDSSCIRGPSRDRAKAKLLGPVELEAGAAHGVVAVARRTRRRATSAAWAAIL